MRHIKLFESFDILTVGHIKYIMVDLTDVGFLVLLDSYDGRLDINDYANDSILPNVFELEILYHGNLSGLHRLTDKKFSLDQVNNTIIKLINNISDRYYLKRIYFEGHNLGFSLYDKDIDIIKNKIDISETGLTDSYKIFTHVSIGFRY